MNDDRQKKNFESGEIGKILGKAVLVYHEKLEEVQGKYFKTESLQEIDKYFFTGKWGN
jgi:hypothetical protein